MRAKPIGAVVAISAKQIDNIFANYKHRNPHSLHGDIVVQQVEVRQNDRLGSFSFGRNSGAIAHQAMLFEFTRKRATRAKSDADVAISAKQIEQLKNNRTKKH